MKSNEPKETLVKPEFRSAKEIWNKGEIIEGLYEVLDGPFDGGMGRVYKVKHLKWGIELAAKCPLPHFWEDKALMKRFEREVEAWTEMGRHPNIVNAYYVRNIDGIPYLFMDWMDGGSLKDWLYRKSWYTHKEEILLYAIGIATGMERIHELGLIHRDLKPANCLISQKYGTIGVSDLGTIKFLGIEDLKEAESLKDIFKGTVWGEMTGMGRFIGTPEYGAPEQFEGKAIKESDIYSFFVMLYQMVCGKLPFELPFEIGRERLTFFKDAHQKKTPKEPKEHVPEIPSSLNELIMQGLAKDPKERPASFTEVKEKLKEIYLEVSGKEYKEPEIDKSYQRADDLNNKALTYIDLGMPEERIKSLFQEALKEEDSHLETIFNYGYFRWKSGEIDPYNDWYKGEILPLELLYKHIGRYWLYRAMAEAEIGLYERAKESAKKAKELGEEDKVLEEILNLPLLKVFKGHTDWINCLSFSPDGKYVASGSRDSTLRLWDIETGNCIKVFKGHTDSVTCLSFSPDGRYVVSGSKDTTLRLWDIETGKCIRVFKGHTEWVTCLSFSPDGRYVVSGSEDTTLRLWDIEKDECIKVFKGHTWKVLSLSFSPDGRYVVSGSVDHTLRLWDIETGNCIRVFKGHTDPVICLSFSPDEKYVVSGSKDETLRLWDIETGNCIKVFKGHTDSVNCLSFSPDGRYVVSGSKDETLRLWDIETGNCIRVFKGHTDPVICLSFSPDEKYVVSGSWDKTLRLWDIEEGKCIRVFKGHTGLITRLSFSPDGRYMVSGSDDTTLRLWDIEKKDFFEYQIAPLFPTLEVLKIIKKRKGLLSKAYEFIKKERYKDAYNVLRKLQKLPGLSQNQEILRLISLCRLKQGKIKSFKSAWYVKTFKGHTNSVNCLSFSPDGRYVVSGSLDKTLRLWDIETGKCIRVFKGHTEWVTCLSFSPDGRYVVSGSEDTTLRLWDIETGKCIRVFKGHTEWVTCLSFSPDGRYVVSGSDDTTLRLWDIETGNCIRVFKGHTGPVYCLSFSPDGRYVVSGSKDTTLRLWEIEKDECIKVFKGHTWKVLSLSFSPDGRYVVSGSVDHTLRLWDIETGNCIRVFEGHIALVTCLSFDPDGRYVVSGSLDKTLRLWDIETGNCIRVFKGHTKEVTCLSFSPDGRYVVSGSWDETLRLWDIKTGKCIGVFKGHTGPVYCLSFSPDGRYVVSGSIDDTLRLWELDWEYEFPEPKDWDEGARPYLEIFLHLHPNWTEEDFKKLLSELELRGYGWLKPEGIKRELEKMSKKRQMKSKNLQQDF